MISPGLSSNKSVLEDLLITADGSSNDCAYFSVVLFLRGHLLNGGTLDQFKHKDEFCRLLIDAGIIADQKGPEKNIDAFKKYLLNTDSMEAQQKLGAIFRKITIGLIEQEVKTESDETERKIFDLYLKPILDKYINIKKQTDKNTFEFSLDYQDKVFCGLLGADYFNQFKLYVENGNTGLYTWWGKEGFKNYLSNLKKAGALTSDVELRYLANYFNFDFEVVYDIDKLMEAKSRPNENGTIRLNNKGGRHWNAVIKGDFAGQVLFKLLRAKGEATGLHDHFEPVDLKIFLSKSPGNQYQKTLDALHQIKIDNLKKIETLLDNPTEDFDTAVIPAIWDYIADTGPTKKFPDALDKLLDGQLATQTKLLKEAEEKKKAASSTLVSPTTPVPSPLPISGTAPPTPPPPSATVTTVTPPIASASTSPSMVPPVSSTPAAATTTTTPAKPKQPTTPRPTPGPPVAAITEDEKKLRETGRQTYGAIIQSLYKSSTLEDKQAIRAAITQSRLTTAQQKKALEDSGISENNEFTAPAGVEVIGQQPPAAPIAALQSKAPCYSLQSGEKRDFKISDGDAKNCEISSEFNNNTFSTVIKSITEDVKKSPSKTDGNFKDLPSDQVFHLANTALMNQVLNAGNSEKQKIHIQTDPSTSEFNKRMIEALILLCEVHGLAYQNDSAHQWKPFNNTGIPPKEVIDYARALTNNKKTMDKTATYEKAKAKHDAQDQRQVEAKIQDLKNESKAKKNAGNFDAKIEAIEQFYKDSIKTDGRVDPIKMTQLFDDFYKDLEEKKPTPTTDTTTPPTPARPKASF